MLAAIHYIPDAIHNMEYALHRMPIATTTAKPLPSTANEIIRYVEQLLTPEEQRICDMATD